jgi:DNA-binding MarR family transcriptional regulator
VQGSACAGNIRAVTEEEAARLISQAVTELFFSAENQAVFHDTAAELGLTPPMLKGLLELDAGDALPMRELADRWGCDASFVTVVVDGLEGRGFAERRVAPHDRRIKAVQLTDEGITAREHAVAIVYGPRAGFKALTAEEQTTLATLLTTMAAAQASYDEELLARPGMRGHVRRATAQRTREFRARAGDHGDTGGGWREHLDAHREELRYLREELVRMRDDLKAQARSGGAEVKATKNEVKAEMKAMRDEMLAQLKGKRPRR